MAYVVPLYHSYEASTAQITAPTDLITARCLRAPGSCIQPCATPRLDQQKVKAERCVHFEWPCWRVAHMHKLPEGY